MAHKLVEIFDRVARGTLPPEDGVVDVVPAPPGLSVAAVVAFPDHHLVAADVDAELIDEHLGSGPNPPLDARFLSWLAAESGCAPYSVDVVLYKLGTGTGTDELEQTDALGDHPRVRWCAAYRDDLEVYHDFSGKGVLVLGAGLAGRRELSIEVPPSQRDAGLGRRLLKAAVDLTPRDTAVWAQIPASNAPSLRAFMAAGFKPVGAEVLFLKGT